MIEIPTPQAGESQDEYISRCIPIVLNEKTAKDGSQAAAICHSMWRKHKGEKEIPVEEKETYEPPEAGNLPEHGKKILAAAYSAARKKGFNQERASKIAWAAVKNAGYHKNAEGQWVMEKELMNHICLRGLEIKEDGRIVGLIATTHPDRVGDILSKNVMNQLAECINKTDESGGQRGSYRLVSNAHDWIHEDNPELDAIGFLQSNAKVIDLKDGHYGVEVECILNPYYKGDMSVDEIKSRIQNGFFSGFSIEYNNDPLKTKNLTISGETFRYIDGLSEYAGVGLARARKIANPKAVIYKEVEDKAMEVDNMVEDETTNTEPLVTPPPATKEEEKKTPEIPKVLSVKEILESTEFKDAVDKAIQVKTKVQIGDKEEQMADKPILSVKEMNDCLKSDHFDAVKFKEMSSRYFEEFNSQIDHQMRTTGIPLNTTLRVKCDGTKMRIVGELQVKATMDTSTNTSSYTESPVEFADVYLPGIIDTYNNQTNLFGKLRKVDNAMGGIVYGWKIAASQDSSLAVDPDNTTVVKPVLTLYNMRTPIKEYRTGVSISDYTLYHSRASIGDLFRIAVEKKTRDLMKDINKALFAAVADGTGNAILGLEAVADSATYTTLYGYTRSTTNRLAPAAAADTYVAVGTALSTSVMRHGLSHVEIEGAERGNLRIVTSPSQRDALFELEDALLNYGQAARLGFAGEISYDGVPIWVDVDCTADSLFIIDMESYYIVISRPPQLIGLAKVGAAEEAYLSIYLAAVYEQPRRIHMLNTLS